jgi:hypothetical protein
MSAWQRLGEAIVSFFGEMQATRVKYLDDARASMH